MPANLDWGHVTRKLRFLEALPSAARASIGVEELTSGEMLFRAGNEPVAMYFVLSGEVRLVRLSRSGSEIVLQRAREGIVAEASLDQSAYHCDAVARVATAVLRIPREVIRRSLREEGFATAWRAELSRELRRLRAQCERLSLHTAHERILHYIEAEGMKGLLTLSQTKKQWAAELGLTHESLYRNLTQMERSGSINVDGRKIRLSNSQRQRARE
jgi:CRP/FNR family transcriptional regulator, dissimilatory nitrate respiration regulator